MITEIDAVGVQFDVPPWHRRLDRNDLYRPLELFGEPGEQMRVPHDDRVHRVTEPILIECSAQRDTELHRVDIVRALRGAGVVEQSLLQRGQRQDIGNRELAAQLVNLLLAECGGRDVGWGQSPASTAHVFADARQRLEPQLAQPAHQFVVERRERPGPVGVQLHAGVRVDGGGVELDGVPK